MADRQRGYKFSCTLAMLGSAQALRHVCACYVVKGISARDGNGRGPFSRSLVDETNDNVALLWAINMLSLTCVTRKECKYLRGTVLQTEIVDH